MLLAMSLVQAGRGMALVGLLLGTGGYLVTRSGIRRPTGPIGRGQERVWKATSVPLMVIGVIGLVLWIVGSLR
jgi:hypothetical protein